MKKIDLNEIDSTNSYLKREYTYLDDMTFVSCKSQTNGHGRYNRKWTSENGKNLLFSLLICNQNLIKRFSELSILTALAVSRVLETYGLNPLIKWPNDVYINEKKICGILLESITKEKIECLIIGVGINVNQTEFNLDYSQSPTSLKLLLNKEIDLEEFKTKIYNEINFLFNENIFFEDYLKEINDKNYLKNKLVSAEINNQIKIVKVISINKDCTLKVISNNEEINLNSGEVTFHSK